jgi:hypothetical protein
MRSRIGLRPPFITVVRPCYKASAGMHAKTMAPPVSGCGGIGLFIICFHRFVLMVFSAVTVI